MGKVWNGKVWKGKGRKGFVGRREKRKLGHLWEQGLWHEGAEEGVEAKQAHFEPTVQIWDWNLVSALIELLKSYSKCVTTLHVLCIRHGRADFVWGVSARAPPLR
eukprot:364943-Chlamydomonas_euryale.AAC.36